MDEDHFRCDDCQLIVPVANRTVHTLVCGRHVRPNTQRQIWVPLPNFTGRGRRLSSGRSTNEPQATSARTATRGETETNPQRTVGNSQTATATSVHPATERAHAPNGSTAAANASVSVQGVQERNSTSVRTSDDESPYLVDCEFCALPVRIRVLEEHSTSCGARTDVCELCLNYVRLRDMRTHKDSACTVATTGSAERSFVDDTNAGEATRLLSAQETQQQPDTTTELSSWAPMAMAVGAIAAAGVGLLLRRR